MDPHRVDPSPLMNFLATLKSDGGKLEEVLIEARHEFHAHQLAEVEAQERGNSWYVYTVRPEIYLERSLPT